MKSRLLMVLAIGLIIAVAVVKVNQAHEVSRLTAAVTAADSAGSDTAAPLAALKSYLHAHAGNHASFTLSGSYNRALAAAQAAAQASAENSQIYAAAQAACASKADSITQAKCNQQYLAQHLKSVPATSPVSTPQLSSYQYNLGSPWFTFDQAGWLELAALAAIIGASLTSVKRSHRL